MGTARLRRLVAGTITGMSVLWIAYGNFAQPPDQTVPAQPPLPMRDAIAMDPASLGLHVALGIGDEKPAVWEGTVSVSAGTVESVALWRPGPNWRVQGDRFFTRTRRQGAQGNVWIHPELYVTLTCPPGASTITLETNQGTAQFALSDLSSDESTVLLDGRASVRRVPPATRISDSGADDDYPAAALAPDGTVLLAYVAFHAGTPLDVEAVDQGRFDSMVTEGHGDEILLTRYDGREWSTPEKITAELGDVWRPTVATDGAGNTWVAWSQNVGDNWDVYRRRRDGQSGKWSDIERLTTEAGADINVVSARDSGGNVWWAWQAWRDNNFDILLTSTAHPDGAAAIVVDGSPANEWNPAIAADSGGNVYVGWDSYAAGNYDVFVRRFRQGDTTNAKTAVAASPRYEARVSLACDRSDRLWIAYEEGDVNWGKDYANANAQRIPIENLGNALYIRRTLRVKCLADDQLLAPQADLGSALASLSNRNKSFPRIATDTRNTVWLLFRHHPLPGGGSENWSSYATSFNGQNWSEPTQVPSSDYLLDVRPALAPLRPRSARNVEAGAADGGLLAVYTSDARLRGGGPDTGASRYAPMPGDEDCDLYATVLTAGTAGGDPLLVPDEEVELDVPLVHPEEREAIARMREHRIEHAGKVYHLLRGEFHRHTEFTAHRDQDGGFEEMWRYALDAADLDWIGNGDHDNGWGRQYPWWIIQKVTDIYHHEPRFVPPFTYERSNIYPNGHRNVMFARRGVRTLPRTELLGTPEEGTPDTKHLYRYLRHFGGICAVHTSGTGMGTDWRDNDPKVEPVVEIYQGLRHNYEHYGAPRSPTQPTNIGGYEPAGFVWNALAKGYRLGFQSSSDHVSTHISYAVVLAEERSRQGLVDAFGKRHCYAAPDNIILDVRAGDHLMGDEFTTAANDPITLEVNVIGTRPVRKIDVIKNNGYVYVYRPENSVRAEFTWKEIGPPARRRGTTSYYYVRVEQEDGQLAWSSPIWVRYQ